MSLSSLCLPGQAIAFRDRRSGLFHWNVITALDSVNGGGDYGGTTDSIGAMRTCAARACRSASDPSQIRGAGAFAP
jgi:hypothetical protein